VPWYGDRSVTLPTRHVGCSQLGFLKIARAGPQSDCRKVVQ